MELALIMVGAGCMIAAVVGGGVKLSQLEIVKFASVARQFILFGLGLILLLVGLGMGMSSRDMQAAKGESGDEQAKSADAAAAAGPPAGNVAAVAAPPAAFQPAAEDEEDEVSSSPPVNVAGLWATDNGVQYAFEQQGLLIGVNISNGLRGIGAVDGDRIGFFAAPAECEGPVSPDRRTISLHCTYQGRTEDVIIRRQ